MRVRVSLGSAFVAHSEEHPFSKREVMRSKLIESNEFDLNIVLKLFTSLTLAQRKRRAL